MVYSFNFFLVLLCFLLCLIFQKHKLYPPPLYIYPVSSLFLNVYNFPTVKPRVMSNYRIGFPWSGNLTSSIFWISVMIWARIYRFYCIKKRIFKFLEKSMIYPLLIFSNFWIFAEWQGKILYKCINPHTILILYDRIKIAFVKFYIKNLSTKDIRILILKF